MLIFGKHISWLCERANLAAVIYSLMFFSQLNEGQTGGPVGVDINVLPVWRKGISGKGVVVSILDDGG